MKNSSDAQRLRETPGFRDLAPAVLEALLGKSTKRRIDTGKTLFEAGQPFLDEVYIVRRGKITLQRANGRTDMATPGYLVGLSSELGDAPEAAIARGDRRAGWNTEAADPGAQTVDPRHILNRQVFVVVRIHYGGGEISFRYASSSQFRCEPVPDGCTTIHKSYNIRLLRLRGQIEQALSAPAMQPIGVSQAVSIVRQVIEEQPRRWAYTAFDVTQERVSAIREVLEPVYYTSPYYDGWGFGTAYGHYGFYDGANHWLYPGSSFVNTAYVSKPHADDRNLGPPRRVANAVVRGRRMARQALHRRDRCPSRSAAGGRRERSVPDAGARTLNRNRLDMIGRT